MNLTVKMFGTVMEKFNVKALEPQGEKFNPEQHEAVSMQEIEGTESGTVVTVMQKGYELNGRLVRPAMVVVAK
jgi:molecular chaperone GrpE